MVRIDKDFVVISDFLHRKNDSIKNLCDKVIVLPFLPNSPTYLDKKFFKTISKIKLCTKNFVIFCFYAHFGSLKSTSCLLFFDGKPINILGETFSHKHTTFVYKNKTFNITLFPYIFDKDYLPQSDYILFLDDEKVENKDFLQAKFSHKIIFFD